MIDCCASLLLGLGRHYTCAKIIQVSMIHGPQCYANRLSTSTQKKRIQFSSEIGIVSGTFCFVEKSSCGSMVESPKKRHMVVLAHANACPCAKGQGTENFGFNILFL